MEGVSSAGEHTCTPTSQHLTPGVVLHDCWPFQWRSCLYHWGFQMCTWPSVWPHHPAGPYLSRTLYSSLSHSFLVSSAKSGAGTLPPTPHQWTTSCLFLLLELTQPPSPTFCLWLLSPKWNSWVVSAETIMQSLGELLGGPSQKSFASPMNSPRRPMQLLLLFPKWQVGEGKKKKHGMKASGSEMFFKDTELVAEPNGKPDAFVPHKDSYWRYPDTSEAQATG